MIKSSQIESMPRGPAFLFIYENCSLIHLLFNHVVLHHFVRALFCKIFCKPSIPLYTLRNM